MIVGKAGERRRACVCQEAEAVEALDGQHGQPEVKGEAGEGGEEDANLCVRPLVLPREDGRQEGDQEHEAVRQEQDDQKFAGPLQVVAPAARAVAQQGLRQRHSRARYTVLYAERERWREKESERGRDGERGSGFTAAGLVSY